MRVGLIGCSGHYNFVLRGIDEFEGAELCAVAPGCEEEDLDPLLKEPGVAAAGPAVYQDYRRMLDEAGLDVVGVDSFFYLHAEICRQALAHGVAPFCEKPLSLDLDSLDLLRKEQERSGLPVGMMLNYRYEPMFYSARGMVASGAIGEVICGYAQKSYKLGRRPHFFRRRETFGGLIPWVGIHAIDWFAWVSGRHYRAVTAVHGNSNSPAYPGLEDRAACLFELDNGGTAVMSFDYLRPQGAPGHGDDRLRLAGGGGVLEIRWPDSMEIFTAGGARREELQHPSHGLFADFLHAVADKRHPCLVSTGDAFAVTGLALRTREAADKGCRIEL